MCALLIAVPVTTESASAAVATNRTAKAKISGWVTVQNGQKKYYKKGQYLKGCKKIENNYYYFGPKGVMKTQDITSHGVTYFIERNGHVLGRRKGSRYMAPDGRKLNKKQTAELRAYQNARKTTEMFCMDAVEWICHSGKAQFRWKILVCVQCKSTFYAKKRKLYSVCMCDGLYGKGNRL